MNIVLQLAHAIEEFDQVRLLTDLGYDVFSPGAYAEPANPGDNKRPALPDAPDHPELRQACWKVRHAHRDDGDRVVVNGEERDVIDWAKYELPQAVLDWADVIIYHHVEHTWLVPQWERLRASGKRIVWRTVGQSNADSEARMAPLHAQGLQIVRYSPKERNLPNFAGEDALIRFYKDPAEYKGWIGDIPAVINFTQHFFQRSVGGNGTLEQPGKQFTNWSFWAEATKGLPAIPMGPGSEVVGGTGEMPFSKMQEMLRRGRAYLYTGTQPASYTLGLIEALMTGIPTVSIGPQWHQVFPYGPDLFEGHEIAMEWAPNPGEAHKKLRSFLDHPNTMASEFIRAQTIKTFGMDVVGQAWRDFLG